MKNRGPNPKSKYYSIHHVNASNYDPGMYSALPGLKFKCRLSPLLKCPMVMNVKHYPCHLNNGPS